MREQEKTARAQGTQGNEDEGAISPKQEQGLRETLHEVNEIARRLLEAAVEVHRYLGPGYVESVYEQALAIEMTLRGMHFERQATFGVDYKGHRVGEGRIDLVVECRLIVELKAAVCITDVHVAQVLSYLKATGLSLALLINFNVTVLMRGVKRIVLSRPSISDMTNASQGP